MNDFHIHCLQNFWSCLKRPKINKREPNNDHYILKQQSIMAGRHNSEDSSTATFLRPQVQIQQHYLLFCSQILFYILHCVEKRTIINKKRPGLAHFLKVNHFVRNKNKSGNTPQFGQRLSFLKNSFSRIYFWSEIFWGSNFYFFLFGIDSCLNLKWMGRGVRHDWKNFDRWGPSRSVLTLFPGKEVCL